MTNFSKNEIFTDHPYNDYEKILDKRTNPKKGYNTIAKLADSEPSPNSKVEALKSTVQNLEKLLMNNYLISEVQFFGQDSQLLETEYFSTEDTIRFPDPPEVADHIFRNWDKTADEIKTAIQNGEKQIVVNAVYEHVVKITVRYSNNLHNPEVFTIGWDTRYSLEAREIPGYRFKWWTTNGRITSMKETYYIRTKLPIEFVAVYESENEPVTEKVPVVCILNGTAYESGANHIIQIFSTYSLPDEYTPIEHGYVRTKQAFDVTTLPDGLIKGAPETSNVKAKASAVTTDANVDLQLARSDLDLVVYARPYTIYEKDGVQTTLYAPYIFSGSYNSVLNGKYRITRY